MVDKPPEGKKEDDSRSEAAGPERLFRASALAAHARGRTHGDLVRVVPGWVGPVYGLVVAAFVAVLLIVTVGRVNEYATGRAIVLLAGHTDVTATETGTIASVLVTSGDRVTGGQILATFTAVPEQNLVDKLANEFEIELVRLLRHPESQDARNALAEIRAELRHARAQLEARTVRAPHDGIVHDLRVRPGQVPARGARLLSLVPGTAAHELVALIPGAYRPMLREGDDLRLELDGFAHAFVDLVIDAIDDDAIGPAEAKRHLGPGHADVLDFAGSVVLVRATIPGDTFVAEGTRHRYHGGMMGTAEIRVRSEPIVVAFMPGLRAVTEAFHGK
jgi:membrane fusion protein (multidrug efflux system)